MSWSRGIRERVWVWVVVGLVCLAAGPAFSQGPEIVGVSFERPTDAVRFYHARVELGACEAAFKVDRAEVSGREATFIATVNGALNQREETGRVGRQYNGQVPAQAPSVFYLQCPWASGGAYSIALIGNTGEGASFKLEAEQAAPAEGGFPFPGWQEHRVLVLREDFGIARENSPYLLVLSEEAARVASWARELRVARYDLASGETTEIPSQVLYEKRRFDTPKQEGAYATSQIAFLVDVPANQKAYYLIAYGNPEAEAPQYETDLKVAKRDDGAEWVENAFFEAKIHPDSGQINAVRATRFGQGEPNTFAVGEECKYQLHYNPDVWVKNRSWTHTNKWNPPPSHVEVQGPVAVVTRRWGPLPWVPEVEVEVAYHFFSQSPYCLVESTMDVKQDVVVNALRNEEVVFAPPEEVDHVGWRRPNGEMVYKPFAQDPALTPGMIGIIEANAPYVCMTREANKFGMASLRLSQHAGSRGDYPAAIASTMTVIADYGWDFRYWSRSLVYPWGDHLPDRSTVLNANTYYGEKSAFCLFPLGEGTEPAERMAFVDALYEKLSHPLQVDHQGAGPW